MIELIVLSGLPASGKTAFCREHLAGHACVSKDHWPNARRREARQRRVVEAHLRAGRSVVVDNTNPSPDERTPLVAIGRAVGARIVSYAFVSTVEASILRNASRAGRARIPEVGILAAAARLRAVLPGEGFDQRFSVRIGERGFVVTDLDVESPGDLLVEKMR